MHRQLADETPDRKGVSVVSIEAAATVDVHRDRRYLAAHDTDRLDSDAMLVRKGRRQQRPGFNRKAHAFFFLEQPFLQYALQEQSRVGDLKLMAGHDAKLYDRLPALREAIVEHHARRGDRVFPSRPLKVEITELDLDFPWIGDGRVGGDERAVCQR